MQAPTSANIAPPGYYMLWIVNTNGSPSVSTMIQLTQAGALARQRSHR